MLSKDTVMNAFASAEQLKAAGKTVRALDNSPLQELVDASYPLSKNEMLDQASTDPVRITGDSRNSFIFDSKESFAESVNYTAMNLENESMHSLRVRAMADNIAPFVIVHLSFARNTVVPLVNETEAALNKFLSMASVKTAESDFKITQAFVPGLLHDESFMAMGLENYKDAGVVNEWIDASLVDEAILTDEVIAQITNMGNDRLNKLVQSWLENAPYALIKRVFLVNFVKAGNCFDTMDKFGRPLTEAASFYEDYSYSQYSASSGRPYDSLSVSLAYFLIATWLNNNPQKTVDARITLADYKNKLAAACISSGGAVNALLKRIMLQVESNIVVSEYNAIRKEIVVHGAVYKTWLEQGGCPEALLGFLVVNSPIYNSNTLLEKKEQGCRAWESYLVIHNTESQRSIKESFTSFVRSHMYNTLADLTDAEKELGAAETVHRERVMANVDAEILHFSHRIMDDVSHLALHLVAKARFYFTSSYSILEEMMDVAKRNPDIDPREAASLATISYIAECLDGQVSLNAIK